MLAPSASADAVRKEVASGVGVLTVRQANGLEFDSAIVADPAGIVAESPRGLNDLYVALTRATQRLGVVHTGELPAPLRAERFDPAALPPIVPGSNAS